MWKMCELEMRHIVLETKMHFSLQSFFILQSVNATKVFSDNLSKSKEINKKEVKAHTSTWTLVQN